jgi:hypothetical protein
MRAEVHQSRSNGLVGIDMVARTLVRSAGAAVKDQVKGLFKVLPFVPATRLTVTEQVAEETSAVLGMMVTVSVDAL